MLRTEGIVLSEIRFKETSKILNIYTRNFGKISVMARGAYRPKSQLVANTQPFSHNEYLLHKGRSFYYLNQGTIINSFYNMREKVERFLYGFYILELVEKSVTEEEKNETIFLLLLKGLKILSHLEEEFEKFAVSFGLKYISFLGYRPHINNCVICGNTDYRRIKFSYLEGGIICDNCFSTDANSRFIDKSMHNGMGKLLYTSLDDLDKVIIDNLTLKRLQSLVEEYILFHIERKGFNSLNMLKSIIKS